MTDFSPRISCKIVDTLLNSACAFCSNRALLLRRLSLLKEDNQDDDRQDFGDPGPPILHPLDEGEPRAEALRIEDETHSSPLLLEMRHPKHHVQELDDLQGKDNHRKGSDDGDDGLHSFVHVYLRFIVVSLSLCFCIYYINIFIKKSSVFY